MRDKVLKSDKYKQAEFSVEYEELHIMLDSMPNSATEEVERSLYEEIVEGFDALQKTRPPAPKDYRLSMSPERREWYRRFQRRSLMKQLGLTEQDMEMIEALDSEEFSFEAMQERWNKIPD